MENTTESRSDTTSVPSETPASERKLSRTQVVVISLAMLLEGMSASSINVQIGAVREALNASEATLGLIAAAFLIAYAGLLPAAGRLVDARDARSVFLTGVALFAVGCVICASSVDGTMLICGRFVQGAGAALSAPAALALITQGLPIGPVRNRAIALYGAMGAAGFSAGLVVPGLVVSIAGWRASFLVLLPIALLVIAVVLRGRVGQRGQAQGVDVRGAALLTLVLMLTVHAVGGIGAVPGWLLAAEAGVAVVIALLLVRRGGVAGYPAHLVGTPRVLGPCVALAAVFAGAIASYYVLSLALETGSGYSALEIGLALLPNPVAFALLAGYGARLITRFGAGKILACGMLLIAAALAYLGLVGLALPPLLGMVPAQVAIGAGLALAFPAASIGAVDAAPAEFRGTVAGLLTTWQNVGGAVGLALVTALGVVPTVSGASDAGPGLYVAATFVLVGGAAAMAVTRSGSKGAHR